MFWNLKHNVNWGLAICIASVSLLVSLLMLRPAASAESASVAHIEVTQSIQDTNGSVPLIAGKRTFVRVFLDYAGSGVARNVRGTIELRRDSEKLQTVDSLAAILTVLDPALNGKLETKRKATNDSLVFEIPTEWTIAGELTISVNGIKLGNGTQINCSNCGKNALVRFGQAAPVRIVLLGLRYVRGGKTLVPRDVDYRSIASWIRRAYPASEFEFQARTIDWEDAPTAFDAGVVSCGEANAVITAFRKLDVAGGKNALFHYYGVVYDGSSVNNFMRGCSSVPTIPDPSAVGSGPAGTGIFAWDQSPSYAGWYAGHELGHTFGRPHPNSGCGDEGDGDPNWPHSIPKDKLGTLMQPFVAFDAGDSDVHAPMSVLAWDQASDLMTYCKHIWPSAHNYLEICKRLSEENKMQCPLQSLAAGPAPSGDMTAEAASISGPGGPVTGLARAILAQADESRSASSDRAPATSFATQPIQPSDASIKPVEGPVLSVTGRINLDGDIGAISSVHRLERSVEKSSAASSDTPLIRTYDDKGNLISQVPAAVLLDSDRPANAPRTGVVSGEVPYASNIARLELVYKDKAIATRSASSSRPAISPPTLEMPALRDLLKNGKIGDPNKLRFDQLNIGPNVARQEPEVGFTKETGTLIYKWQNQTNASVKYTVQISTNGGKDWNTVALESSQHSIAIDPGWLEGASTLDVRVRASDGIHETFSTSKQLDLNARAPIP